MSYKIALVGNPNCGKTTMFNEITGSTQHVGNWAGVTVEKKEGSARKFKEDIRIVDLPGIYSLSPYSMEEIIARDYIVDENPDVVVNIVDASNIERNLYLTLQLIELGVPVVVALNFMDVVESRGDKIDIEKLQKQLGVPVLATSAVKGKGVFEVIQKAVQLSEICEINKAEDINGISIYRTFDESIETAILKTEEYIQNLTSDKKYSSRWLAIKLLEVDSKVAEKIQPAEKVLKEIKGIREVLENEFHDDMETIIADNSYKYIARFISSSVKKAGKNHSLTTSDKIDKIVTNRILAIPIFLGIMFIIFRITFGVIGSFTVDWTDAFINETISGAVSSWLENSGAAPWLHSLIVDGIIAGVGGVLIFVGQIMLLFLFLAILEDTGYMARAAFVMDKLLRKFGLSGKSFIPMLVGFGCSVPGIMASRTLENEKDRKLTIILTPFMSCGARLPVYALFAAAFFAENQSAVIFSIYVLGIVVAILSGILLKKTVFKGEPAPFVMELPPYRIPTLKGLAIHMWDRGKGFIKKAGTIIFTASVIIWFCQSFNFGLQMVENPSDSIFAFVGRLIAPVFAPLGFGDWKTSMTLLTGLVAKEVVVSTMGILHGIGEVGEDTTVLIAALQGVFTPLKAYSFMAFTLLYMPCIAAFGAIKREMNSWKWTWFAVGFQTLMAWMVAFLIFQVGSLFGLS